MKLKQLYYAHVFLLSALGSVIACSPTKFTPAVAVNADCTTGCVVNPDGTKKWDEVHKIGTGKVDILFVNDNSASMSVIQQRMAQAFGGFIERLDAREIDYKIAMTTTDVTKLSAAPLLSFGNGSTFLTKGDSNRVALFNGAIVRTETTKCEEVIKSYYNTYGPSFQSNSNYAAAYNNACASSDERGILAANYILQNNTGSFVRTDAHLNIIVISNEDVRSGETGTFTTEDRASNLISTVNSKFTDKYWEFNSVITKDAACAQSQKSQFRSNGQEIKDQNGNYVIGANPGVEYAAVSASSSKDINGNAQPRGQIIDICQTNYSSYFINMATKVADAALRFDLKCTPATAPVVEVANNPAATIPHTWNGNNIVFTASYQGTQVRVKYSCPQTGGVQ
ncbi:hypothetical protein CIK05_03405 [Bdellovibrio sp. qaytius]|nr:hypothetical protein CIK05_03405 [Bdellovibrio sp. qaytius]